MLRAPQSRTYLANLATLNGLLKETMRELMSIMSTKGMEEAELSPEISQIYAPSSTIQCRI